MVAKWLSVGSVRQVASPLSVQRFVEFFAKLLASELPFSSLFSRNSIAFG